MRHSRPEPVTFLSADAGEQRANWWMHAPVKLTTQGR